MCGGDSSTCNTIKGDFMQETLTVGYNDIVLIPAGATSIYVEELEATNNYLGKGTKTSIPRHLRLLHQLSLTRQLQLPRIMPHW